MGEDNIYKLNLTGKEVEERLRQKIPSTTDDIEGGEEIWILKCGDSKTNID